jgi:hypothetical protein
MSVPAKRAREDETAANDENGLLDRLLKADPEKLVSFGRKNAKILSDLRIFSTRLQTSIDQVTKEQQQEAQAAAKAWDGAIQTAKEAKKKQWVASNTCFECKNSADILQACVGFKEEGVTGSGSLVCDDCQDKVTKATCPQCNTFLCRSNQCCDDSYKCTGCEETICVPCAEKDDYGGKGCECGDWYCDDCANYKIVEEQCCSCSKPNIYCKNCNYNKLDKCDGDCEEPLCDKCVTTLNCGNDARICGVCDFDCVDCDMCAGYY